MSRLALLLLLAIGSAALAAEPPRTVRDFGAVGNGQTDDTAALQAAVDASAGDVLFPRGVYRISRPIVVELDRVGPTALAGTGAATVVMAGPGPAFRLVGTHAGSAAPSSVLPNVWERQRTPMLTGLEIVGDHAESGGVEATGTMQLTLTRLTIRRVQHAVRLYERNRNVIVSDCHIYENRGVGLLLDDVNLHQINVTGCHISYNAQGGIVSRAGNVRNLHVTGCDIEGNFSAEGPPTANVLIDGTGGAWGTAEVAITGCTIQHTAQAVDSANIRFIGADAQGRRWGQLAITGNVLSDVQMNIDVEQARGVTIAGNTINRGQQYNLRLIDCVNVSIGPNDLERNVEYEAQVEKDNPVLLSGCDGVAITGLLLHGVHRQPAGLILEKCRRVNVTGCTVLDCENAGILLRDCTLCRVANCLVASDAKNEGWRPVVVTGGEKNQVVENLLDE